MNWANDRRKFLRLASLAKHDWGFVREADSWDVIDRELNRLRSISKQYNFDVAVIAFPVSFQVHANYIENTPQQTLQRKAVELGDHYFDLLPILRKHSEEDLFFDRYHPRIKTNEIIGKAPKK